MNTNSLIHHEIIPCQLLAGLSVCSVALGGSVPPHKLPGRLSNNGQSLQTGAHWLAFCLHECQRVANETLIWGQAIVTVSGAFNLIRRGGTNFPGAAVTT
jgi:hypothetical protein